LPASLRRFGCPICKQTGWIDSALRHGRSGRLPGRNRARGDDAYDPKVWSGFAFGFGGERLAMLRHGITDIRRFLENDLDF